jgi:hypothetical protein
MRVPVFYYVRVYLRLSSRWMWRDTDMELINARAAIINRESDRVLELQDIRPSR